MRRRSSLHLLVQVWQKGQPSPITLEAPAQYPASGFLFGTPLIFMGLADKYAPNPQAPSPSDPFAGRVTEEAPA